MAGQLENQIKQKAKEPDRLRPAGAVTKTAIYADRKQSGSYVSEKAAEELKREAIFNQVRFLASGKNFMAALKERAQGDDAVAALIRRSLPQLEMHAARIKERGLELGPDKALPFILSLSRKDIEKSSAEEAAERREAEAVRAGSARAERKSFVLGDEKLNAEREEAFLKRQERLLEEKRAVAATPESKVRSAGQADAELEKISRAYARREADKAKAAAERESPKELADRANAWKKRRVDEYNAVKAAEFSDGYIRELEALVRKDPAFNEVPQRQHLPIWNMQQALARRTLDELRVKVVEYIEKGGDAAGWARLMVWDGPLIYSVDFKYGLQQVLDNTAASFARKLLARPTVFPRTKALIERLRDPLRGVDSESIQVTKVTQPFIAEVRSLGATLEKELHDQETLVSSYIISAVKQILRAPLTDAMSSTFEWSGKYLFKEEMAKRSAHRAPYNESRAAEFERRRAEIAAEQLAARSRIRSLIPGAGEPGYEPVLSEEEKQEQIDEAEARDEIEGQQWAEEMAKKDARLRKSAKRARRPLPEEPEAPVTETGEEASPLLTALVAPSALSDEEKEEQYKEWREAQEVKRAAAEKESEATIRTYRKDYSKSIEQRAAAPSADMRPAGLRPLPLFPTAHANVLRRRARSEARDQRDAARLEQEQFDFLVGQLKELSYPRRSAIQLDPRNQEALKKTDAEIELLEQLKPLAKKLGREIPANLLGLSGRPTFLSLFGWR